MKKINFLLLGLFLFTLAACNKTKEPTQQTDTVQYVLPRVLLLTTGQPQGNGTLPEGVVVASQFFNRNGALVTVNTRDVLMDEQEMKKYQIIVALTAAGYHDADRGYSLTYLSDKELQVIHNWVKDGGLLIAGDNFGRNKIDGSDRTSIFGTLTKQNWPLADCFGVTLSEKDMKEFQLVSHLSGVLSGTILPPPQESVWRLAVDSVYDSNVTVLASWQNQQEQIPALLYHPFGKGHALLLPSSYLLHPANVGGIWGVTQIEAFYTWVLQQYQSEFQLSFSLNVWPNACDAAFCVTLNTEGNPEEYKRILDLFETEKITPTFFVRDELNDAVKKIIAPYPLQSNGRFKFNSKFAPFYEINRSILENEIQWNRRFDGFRFPFTIPGYSGFDLLAGRGYKYDSSIGVDNLQSIYGATFPYAILIANEGRYKNTGMLEISPILHDDYHFLAKISNSSYSEAQLQKDALLYRQYLQNMWEMVIKPNHGLFVWQGHPVYSGHSDSTLGPLKLLIKKVKEENIWITNTDEVYLYWHQLEQTQFQIEESGSEASIKVLAPQGISIQGVTLRCNKKIGSAKSSVGTCDLITRNGIQYIVFEVVNGQQINVKF